MLITKELCLQILNKTKEHEHISAVPKTDDQIIKQGTFWINETLKARLDSSLKWDKAVIELSNIIAEHRYFTD